MGAHIFNAGDQQCRRNILHMRDPLWIGQVRIEVAVHQQLGPLGTPTDSRGIDMVPDVVIRTVNWLHYLNNEAIPSSSSICH